MWHSIVYAYRKILFDV